MQIRGTKFIIVLFLYFCWHMLQLSTILLLILLLIVHLSFKGLLMDVHKTVIKIGGVYDG